MVIIDVVKEVKWLNNSKSGCGQFEIQFITATSKKKII